MKKVIIIILLLSIFIFVFPKSSNNYLYIRLINGEVLNGEIIYESGFFTLQNINNTYRINEKIVSSVYKTTEPKKENHIYAVTNYGYKLDKPAELIKICNGRIIARTFFAHKNLSYDFFESINLRRIVNINYNIDDYIEIICDSDFKCSYNIPYESTSYLITTNFGYGDFYSISNYIIRYPDDHLYFDNYQLVHGGFRYDYYIGRYEVTFEQYDNFCKTVNKIMPNDQSWGRNERPVINISWWDAIEYCNWLSLNAGLAPAYNSKGNFLDKNGRITKDLSQVEGYRLPTNEEWAFAAAGGLYINKDVFRETYDYHLYSWLNPSFGYTYDYYRSNYLNNIHFYNDLYQYYNKYAWLELYSFNRTNIVGSKQPNELGLYDMIGNVWEWTNNVDNNFHVHTYIRGGAFNTKLDTIVYNNLQNKSKDTSYYNLGFRVVRTIIK